MTRENRHRHKGAKNVQRRIADLRPLNSPAASHSNADTSFGRIKLALGFGLLHVNFCGVTGAEIPESIEAILPAVCVDLNRIPLLSAGPSAHLEVLTSDRPPRAFARYSRAPPSQYVLSCPSVAPAAVRVA